MAEIIKETGAVEETTTTETETKTYTQEEMSMAELNALAKSNPELFNKLFN